MSAEHVSKILYEIKKIREAGGYTGHFGDEPADIWLGSSLYVIEDIAKKILADGA
jgi:hypothetical protein